MYREKLFAITGFLGIGVGTVSGILAPVSGYEISIYSGTPLLFWLGCIAGLLSAVILLFRTRSITYGFSVGSLTITSIVLLPIVRGYYFYGEDDPLTHLGWTRDLLSGGLPLREFLYPGLHLNSGILSILIEQPPRITLLLASSTFPLVWLLTIPLVIREISYQKHALAIGFISAAALLPLNPFNVFLHPHPSSQVIFFSPFVLYLFIKYQKSVRHRRIFIILGIAFCAALFTHVQQALNIFIVCTVLSILSPSFQNREQQSAVRTGITFVLAIGFTATIWLLSNARVQTTIAGIILRISRGFGGTSAAAKTQSLSALNVDLLTFGLKLAAPYVIATPFIVICLYSAISSYRHEKQPYSEDVFTRILAIAAPLFLLPTGLFILAGNSNQWGRYIGFGMVIATILFALGLLKLYNISNHHVSRPQLRTALSAVICLLLIVSLIGMYPSPYYEKPNQQVTREAYSGYETAFNYTPAASEFVGVRSSAYRYRDAIYGSYPNTEKGGEYVRVPDHFANQSLGSYYNDTVYLMVTGADYKRDVELYNGLRYTADDFAYLDQTPRISIVLTTGNTSLYYIENHRA